MLRRLDAVPALRVLQQVAVVQRADAEVLEQLVPLRRDGIVQLARVDRGELRDAVVDEAEGVPRLHGLREGVDVLVAHFLVYEDGEETRGQLGVLRLLCDERRGGADGEFVQLAGGRAVVQSADGAGGDAQRVDALQSSGGALDRAHDLHHVGGLEPSVPLADVHGCGRSRVRWHLLRRPRAELVGTHHVSHFKSLRSRPPSGV